MFKNYPLKKNTQYTTQYVNLTQQFYICIKKNSPVIFQTSTFQSYVWLSGARLDLVSLIVSLPKLGWAALKFG